MDIPLRNDLMHIDDVQFSASCLLLIISTITTVIQLIKSSANLRHHLMGRGEGERGVGGEERLFLGKTACCGKLANFKICCFVLELEFLPDIHHCNNLPSHP